MSWRDNNSRCQGFTPSELQPALIKHPAAIADHSFHLYLSIVHLLRSLFRQQIFNPPCILRFIRGTKSDTGKPGNSVTVDQDARWHTPNLESFRELSFRIEANAKIRFEFPEESLGICALTIEVDGNDGQATPLVALLHALHPGK